MICVIVGGGGLGIHVVGSGADLEKAFLAPPADGYFVEGNVLRYFEKYLLRSSTVSCCRVMLQCATCGGAGAGRWKGSAAFVR